jgi:hypothetical protein
MAGIMRAKAVCCYLILYVLFPISLGMKWRLLLYPAFIIICYVTFRYLDNYNIKHYGCDLHKEVYEQSLSFKVTQKFIDQDNHNIPVLIYVDNNNQQQRMTMMNLMEVYDSAEIGDSVIKQKNALWYKIISGKTGEVKLAQFYSHCKDSLKYKR